MNNCVRICRRRFNTSALVGAIVFAIAAVPKAFPFDPPRPNPYLEKQLVDQGISHQEWLLFDGIRKRNTEQVAYALDQGVDPNDARDTIGPFPPLIVAITQHSPNESIISCSSRKGLTLTDGSPKSR